MLGGAFLCLNVTIMLKKPSLSNSVSVTGCNFSYRLRWRTIYFITLVIWTLLMSIISTYIGFNLFVIITMLLLIVGGLTKRTKCWNTKDVLHGFVPFLLIIILFSIVLLMTTPSVLELLGISSANAVATNTSLQTSINNAYWLLVTSTPNASTLGWYYIYLPMYIIGAIAVTLGDMYDIKIAKAAGVLLVFLPTIITIISIAIGSGSLGLLNQYMTLTSTGNQYIDGFILLSASTLDWLIAALILSIEKLIPESQA